MKNDFVSTIFFWSISVIILCFFSWSAFEELMTMQIEQEHAQAIFEFNQKVSSGMYE